MQAVLEVVVFLIPPAILILGFVALWKHQWLSGSVALVSVLGPPVALTMSGCSGWGCLGVGVWLMVVCWPIGLISGIAGASAGRGPRRRLNRTGQWPTATHRIVEGGARSKVSLDLDYSTSALHALPGGTEVRARTATDGEWAQVQTRQMATGTDSWVWVETTTLEPIDEDAAVMT